MFDSYFKRISELTPKIRRFGIIDDLIESEDEETKRVLDEILSLPNDEKQKIILTDKHYEKRAAEKRIRNGENLLITPEKHDNIIKDIESSKSVFDWFISSGTINCFLYVCPNRDVNECFAQYLLSTLYKSYLRTLNARYNRNQDSIATLFSNEQEYQKYELVSLNDKRKFLKVLNNPRIFDLEKNKTYLLQAIEQQVADELALLHKKGLIETLSFRIKNDGVHDGEYKMCIFNEEVERGKIYSDINIGNDVIISALYDAKKYSNHLFILTNQSEITFEELIDDFDIYDNSIVTQVVHLQFEITDNNPVIRHIDHEFIYYTIEEYLEKEKNIQQKGAAHNRVKTFKADNCEIPFDYQCSVRWKEYDSCNRLSERKRKLPFIQFILENYFENIDLIQEFFQKGMDPCKQDKNEIL